MAFDNQHQAVEQLLDDAIVRNLSSIDRLRVQIDCICQTLRWMAPDGLLKSNIESEETAADREV